MCEDGRLPPPLPRTLRIRANPTGHVEAAARSVCVNIRFILVHHQGHEKLPKKSSSISSAAAT